MVIKMIKCSQCKKNILLPKNRYNIKDAKGNELPYCEACFNNVMRKKREIYNRQKKEADFRENKIRTEKALKINDTWEYIVSHFSADSAALSASNERINKLGREGWELVGITSVGKSDVVSGHVATLIMAFKRKISPT